MKTVCEDDYVWLCGSIACLDQWAALKRSWEQPLKKWIATFLQSVSVELFFRNSFDNTLLSHTSEPAASGVIVDLLCHYLFVLVCVYSGPKLHTLIFWRRHLKNGPNNYVSHQIAAHRRAALYLRCTQTNINRRIPTQTHTFPHAQLLKTGELGCNALTRPDPQVCVTVRVIYSRSKCRFRSEPVSSPSLREAKTSVHPVCPSVSSPFTKNTAEHPTTSPKQQHTRTDGEVCVDADRKEEREREREREREEVDLL